jgi:hypothetical protein
MITRMIAATLSRSPARLGLILALILPYMTACTQTNATSHGSTGGQPAVGGGGGGGADRAETGSPDTLVIGSLWSPACPNDYVPVPGVNTGFPTPTGDRSFSLNLPTDTSTLRPVWVPLTGSVESTNENLDSRGGNRAMVDEGYIVIGPVRRCAVTVDGGDTTMNGGACNTSGTGGWTWNPWNEGRAFDSGGDQWKTDEGPDSRFFEAIVKCVATKYSVDQTRLYIGGISSGGTMTNRALTFRSDFWAGGMPISGEWYVTKDDGTSYTPGGDDFTARGDAVSKDPTKIFQGRVGPFPLKDKLAPMIVITVWGGTNDLWECGPNQTPPLCADYRPTTQVASNYYSSMDNVVHVACSTSDGHQWPFINRGAFNRWALKTLSSQPKGTSKDAFALTDPPSGYACKLGPFTDHY